MTYYRLSVTYIVVLLAIILQVVVAAVVADSKFMGHKCKWLRIVFIQLYLLELG